MAALASFGAGSGAGLFAYRPFILQQCARVESDSFLRALSAVVNLLASGEGPSFLRPFLSRGCVYCLLETQKRRSSLGVW